MSIGECVKGKLAGREARRRNRHQANDMGTYEFRPRDPYEILGNPVGLLIADDVQQEPPIIRGPMTELMRKHGVTIEDMLKDSTAIRHVTLKG